MGTPSGEERHQSLEHLLDPEHCKWRLLCQRNPQLNQRRSPTRSRSLEDTEDLQIKGLFSDWNFNLFETFTGEAVSIPESQILSTICRAAYMRYNFAELNAFESSSTGVEWEAWSNLWRRVEHTYTYDGVQNQYHNSTHAADVVQTVCVMCSQPRLCSAFTMYDVFVLVLTAAVHDYNHAGFTNAFLVQTEHPIAVMFSDDSVLERHHLYSIFQVLQEPATEIMANFTRTQRRYVRSSMIKLVLSTDLARSTVVYHQFDEAMNKFEATGSSESNDVRLALLQMVLKCADVSHATKKRQVHLLWTRRVTSEFFRQGDQERTLGISVTPLCDRTSANIATSQCGFIDYVVRKPFEAMYRFTGDTHVSRTWKQNIRDNYDYWEEQGRVLAHGELPHLKSLSEIRANSRRIETQQQRDASKEEAFTKVLILGTGNSGKTTFLKQMDLMYGDVLKNADNRQQYIGILRDNLRSIAKIYDPTIRDRKHSFNANRPPSPGVFNALCAHERDTREGHTVKDAFPTNTDYLIRHFRRILAPDFVPTIDDVLHARKATVGIQTTLVSVNDSQIKFIDVGGQASERRKWVHMFDSVTAVVYIISLVDYAERGPDTRRSNNLSESLDVLRTAMDFQCFKHTPFIIFLNKSDLLQETLRKKPIIGVFPKAPRSNRPKEVEDFFFHKLVRLHKSSKNDAEFSVYVTTATDSDNARRTWATCRHIILCHVLASRGMFA